MAISVSLVTSTTLLLRVSSTLATTTCNQGEVSQQAYGQLASWLQPHIPYSLWSAGLLAAATHPLQPMVSWPLGCSHTSPTAYGQLASQLQPHIPYSLWSLASWLQPHIPYSLWSAGLLAAATHPLQPMVRWPLGCSHTSPTASKRNNLHLLYAPAFATRQNNKDDLVKTLSLTERQRERDINTHYEQKTKADFFLQSKLSFQPSRSSNKGQT